MSHVSPVGYFAASSANSLMLHSRSNLDMSLMYTSTRKGPKMDP